MLKTESLSHQYSGTQRFQFPDINCKASETLLVLGQSGVGKSTLLHILAGILQPKNGHVYINDQSLYSLPGHQRDLFRGKNIGLIFQKSHFVSSLNAEENLMLAQKMAGQKVNKKATDKILEQLNIHNRTHAMTNEMSQGELQRLSIARALINQPQLILADEPTSSLDDKHCVEVINLLEEHSVAVNASLIVVTHDNRLKQMFDNRIELN